MESFAYNAYNVGEKLLDPPPNVNKDVSFSICDMCYRALFLPIEMVVLCGASDHFIHPYCRDE